MTEVVQDFLTLFLFSNYVSVGKHFCIMTYNQIYIITTSCHCQLSIRTFPSAANWYAETHPLIVFTLCYHIISLNYLLTSLRINTDKTLLGIQLLLIIAESAANFCLKCCNFSQYWNLNRLYILQQNINNIFTYYLFSFWKISSKSQRKRRTSKWFSLLCSTSKWDWLAWPHRWTDDYWCWDWAEWVLWGGAGAAVWTSSRERREGIPSTGGPGLSAASHPSIIRNPNCSIAVSYLIWWWKSIF